MRLSPGHTLRVSLVGCEPPNGQRRPRLLLRFDEDPFETATGQVELTDSLMLRAGALPAFLGEAVAGLTGHVADSGGWIALE